MKKYLITGILLLSIFVYAQEENCPVVTDKTKEVQEKTENNINKLTTESKITNNHYTLRLGVSAKGFTTLANASKFGHKEGGAFDTWQKRNGDKGYYMLHTEAEGKTHLYYEELDKQTAKQFQKHLPKGITSFDEKTYNAYFKDIDFSSNHWKAGGDVDSRLADIRKLAVAISRNLGISLDPAKITYRLFETQQIEGLPSTRMYIPTKRDRNDNIGGFAKWDDKVTSIEIDAERLGKASISEAVSVIAEEVFHKYQMSEVVKFLQGKEVKDSEKTKAWDKSFKDNDRIDLGKAIIDLQKQSKAETDKTKRDKLQEEEDKLIHLYFGLAHEETAKDFAGKIAAMEYAVRNNITNPSK
jgi:hypothetical protein